MELILKEGSELRTPLKIIEELLCLHITAVEKASMLKEKKKSSKTNPTKEF